MIWACFKVNSTGFLYDFFWQCVTSCHALSIGSSVCVCQRQQKLKNRPFSLGDLHDITGGAFMSALTYRYETTGLMQHTAMLIIVHLGSRRLNYTIYGGEGEVRGDTVYVWIHISFTLRWMEEGWGRCISLVPCHYSHFSSARSLLFNAMQILT